MSIEPEPHLSPAQVKNLSALADGTLHPAQQASVQAWIDADPSLRRLYERERRAVAHLNAARAHDRAPERLRARIEAARGATRTRARRSPRLGQLSLAGGALATATAAIVIGLSGGGTSIPPALGQAAALATLGPTQPAPPPNPDAPRVKLDVDVQDVYFPNWSTQFHWRATGVRIDQVASRPAVTVYYGWRHDQLAYTILGTGPLPQPGGQPVVLGGYRLYTFTSGRRTIVTWRRDGHTCVLSATGVPVRIMQRLAAWQPPAIKA